MKLKIIATPVDSEFDEKNFDALNKIQHENDFISIWSIYDVAGLNQVAFQGDYKLTYPQHWGKQVKPIQLPKNPTWMDLWKASDILIRRSTDLQHVFIEIFNEKNGMLTLTTGS